MRILPAITLLTIAISIPPTIASSHADELLPAHQQQQHHSAATSSPSGAIRDLHEREIIIAPPVAQPTRPTQVSPVMTIDIGGKPALYTQRFSAVPDQWPPPKKGTIGLGTLKGKVEQTKTVDKREAAPLMETGDAAMALLAADNGQLDSRDARRWSA